MKYPNKEILERLGNAMTTQKYIIGVAFISFFSLAGQSQTATTIEAMESKYQSCLDKGKDMLACSKAYYRQMDSMLNVVYNKLRSTLDSSQKAQLKREQLQWLAKRDNYFQKTKIDFKKNHQGVDADGEDFGAQDEAMIMFDKNAAFVQERVLVLIDKLKKIL